MLFRLKSASTTASGGAGSTPAFVVFKTQRPAGNPAAKTTARRDQCCVDVLSDSGMFVAINIKITERENIPNANGHANQQAPFGKNKPRFISSRTRHAKWFVSPIRLRNVAGQKACVRVTHPLAGNQITTSRRIKYMRLA